MINFSLLGLCMCFPYQLGGLTVGAPIYASHWVEFNVHSPASIVFAGKTSIV
ncbi:hypothetical protein HNQ69_000793 [Bartonella callosciuri]|uniref:Uncharacterized protein n=1 Tax=Bartonella callosciuri TaxID=686223 RepID=A0A840P043_9HYPH|nr:hypothetical protein [Bartonella callosciuri]